MEIGVTGPIFTHKNNKGSMVKECPHSTKWVKKSVNSLFFETRSIFLQLCDHQDNESE